MRSMLANSESILHHRKQFLEKFPKIAPTSAVKVLNFQARQGDPETALYCGRPRDRYDVLPTVLLHRTFSQFLRDCETVNPQFEDNLFAERLVDVASKFYDNESSRIQAVDEEFKTYYLHFTAAQMSKQATSRVLSVNGHHYAIMQYKNEMGDASDAYHLALHYYVQWTRETAKTFWMSPLPCLLVIVLGWLSTV